MKNEMGLVSLIVFAIGILLYLASDEIAVLIIFGMFSIHMLVGGLTFAKDDTEKKSQ